MKANFFTISFALFCLSFFVPVLSVAEEKTEEQKLIEQSLKEDSSGDKSLLNTAPVNQPSTGGLQSMNPDMSFIFDFAGAWFNTEKPLQVGSHDPQKVGFSIRQLEFALSSDVDHYYKMKANLIFSEFGVEIEELYGIATDLGFSLQGRAGLFLTRFGRSNNTHPHSWNFVDQRLVNGKFFGSEGSRGKGIELSWLSPLPWYMELVTSMTEAGGECCAKSFYGSNDPGIDPENQPLKDLLYTVALKQFFELGEDWAMLLGFSGQFGPNPNGRDTRTEIFGVDLYFRYEPAGALAGDLFSWQTEFMHRQRQVIGDSLEDKGLYSELYYRFTKYHAFAYRYDFVEGFENDPLDPSWTMNRERHSLSFTWAPTHFSKVILQGNYDDPKWQEKIYALILNIEFLIGAHRAHAY